MNMSSDMYIVFFLMILLPPGSTLFPYTTLFRSVRQRGGGQCSDLLARAAQGAPDGHRRQQADGLLRGHLRGRGRPHLRPDRKSTRLNSSHANISYAVFSLKKNYLSLFNCLALYI